MKKGILHWLFIESHAKWLFMILAFEYFVAVNLSPTILTDYPVLNWIVEKMAFIPSIHNFDEVAVHPEAVRFYIAFALIMVIPKSISFHHFLEKNPITEMRQYVITPYSMTKPKRTAQIFAPRMSQEEAKQLPTVERSLLSRFFWSIMTLFFAFMMVVVIVSFKNGSFVLTPDNYIPNGGITMWFALSVKFMMLCAALLAISAFIIKDYIKYFKEKLS